MNILVIEQNISWIISERFWVAFFNVLIHTRQLKHTNTSWQQYNNTLECDCVCVCVHLWLLQDDAGITAPPAATDQIIDLKCVKALNPCGRETLKHLKRNPTHKHTNKYTLRTKTQVPTLTSHSRICVTDLRRNCFKEQNGLKEKKTRRSSDPRERFLSDRKWCKNPDVPAHISISSYWLIVLHQVTDWSDGCAGFLLPWRQERLWLWHQKTSSQW